MSQQPGWGIYSEGKWLRMSGSVTYSMTDDPMEAYVFPSRRLAEWSAVGIRNPILVPLRTSGDHYTNEHERRSA